MLARRLMGRSRDSGAAAVEFALVVPVLVLLVMGIIDYGLFFSDRLAVKQGIREGARDAVVSPVNVCDDDSLDCLADKVKDKVGAVGGTVYVHIDPVAPGSYEGDVWAEGNELRVCVVVTEDGLTGITPMPKMIVDSLRMRIEHDNLSGGVHGQLGEPPGGWAWCHDA